MRPIKTNRSNFVYTGPSEGIGDLHCQRGELEGGAIDGIGVVYSVWELTKEEREFVARGGNIKLGIIGMEPIPPVSIQIVHESMEEER